VPLCRCAHEPSVSITFPRSVTKLCIYVASEPVQVELARYTADGTCFSNHTDLLHKGLNVRCLCKYLPFGRKQQHYVLLAQRVKLIKLSSAAPEIVTFLALDFHEPLTLAHLATAQISTLRLSEKQLRDYCVRVCGFSLDSVALPLPRDMSWKLAIAGSLSRVQRIFLKFNLSGQQLSCASAQLLHNPHYRFVNRLDIEELKYLSRIRSALLNPIVLDLRQERDHDLYFKTPKFPFLSSPVFWSNPRKRGMKN